MIDEYACYMCIYILKLGTAVSFVSLGDSGQSRSLCLGRDVRRFELTLARAHKVKVNTVD